MTTFRSALRIARFSTFASLVLFASPTLAHHAMSGREPATPIDKLLGDAAHLLLDAAPAALLAGGALLLVAAAAALWRGELRT